MPENNNIITFTRAGTEYQAEEGMTWEEWVNSKYNNNEINKFIINTNALACIPRNGTETMSFIFYDEYGDDYVYANDLIQANYSYH